MFPFACDFRKEIQESQIIYSRDWACQRGPGIRIYSSPNSKAYSYGPLCDHLGFECDIDPWEHLREGCRGLCLPPYQAESQRYI